MRRAGKLSVIVALIGAVLFIIGIIIEPRQALTSYVFAYAVAFTIVLGALFHLMIGQLTGARWFDAFRQLALNVTAATPALAVLVIPILLGVRAIYPWTAPSLLSPDAQRLIARKAGWLNVPFFSVRAIVYVAIWVIFAELVRRLSVRREGASADDDSVRAHKLRKTSAAGVIFVGLALTFASFDWLMSLEPTWYSTIYGVYLFAGGILAALGLVAAMASRRAGGRASLLDSATDDQRGALGTLLFTYTIFWAYIGFAQFLIIWIGDIPAEASWYVTRTRTSWAILAVLTAVGQFALPFLLLLPHSLKRRPGLLAWVGVWIVAMHVVDVYWIVLPALHPGGISLSWLDAAALLLVGGVIAGTMHWRTAMPEYHS
ncbi:MAG TPA: hypothetical protein VGM67_19905 [Gemmatimonadaceae bacterium]|jgi:hypothetical protein